jgi:putative nucleotidyltransferase with HDIG domain
MPGRRALDWWRLYVRGLAAAFAAAVLVVDAPRGAGLPGPEALLLLALLVPAGLLGAWPSRANGTVLAANAAGTAVELAVVSAAVHLTGGTASPLFFLYVPVVIWGTAGRGLAVGVLAGWTAASAFAVVAALMGDSAAQVIPRAAMLLFLGILVGLIEQRRGEAEVVLVRDASALNRRVQSDAEIRAALAEMGPLDLPGRARLLLERSLRIAFAEHGLVVLLDADDRPVVEASVPGPAGGCQRGEVLRRTAVLESALSSGRIQSAVDAGHDARWASVFGGEAVGSALLVPLVVGGGSIGALFLARRNARLFSTEVQEAVGALAQTAAILLADARAQVRAHDFQLSTVNVLAAALEAKDPYTRGHSQRVASNAVAIAAELGLPPEEVERIRWASLLHDLGKIGTPESILRKRSTLSDEERAVMNMHAERGASILRQMAPFRPIVDPVRYHQESWDGSGYPEGLAGEKIPLAARIIRVADAFDALTSDRPYRKGLSVADASGELQAMAGTVLDPSLVQVFLRVLAEKPPFEVQLRMWRER